MSGVDFLGTVMHIISELAVLPTQKVVHKKCILLLQILLYKGFIEPNSLFFRYL